MEDENKNGAQTDAEPCTELQGIKQEDMKEAQMDQAEPEPSDKLLVVEQESKEEAESPVEASTELQTMEQETKDEAVPPPQASTKLQATEQETKDDAETPLEASTGLQHIEQETKDDAEPPLEASTGLQHIEQETKEDAEPPLEASTALQTTEQETKNDAETPSEASTGLQTVEQEKKDEAEMPAETIQSQPPEKTAASSTRKLVKKSAATSSLITNKGKAALSVKKKIVKKKIVKMKKGASLIIDEGNRNGKETESAKEEDLEQKDDKEAATPAEVSIKFQTPEQETEKEAEIPVETSLQAEARAPQKRTPDSMKARANIIKKALPEKALNTAVGKAAPNKVQKKIVKKNNKGEPLDLKESSRNSGEVAREPASKENRQMGSGNDGNDTGRNNRKDTINSEYKNGKEPASNDVNDKGKIQSEQGNTGRKKRRQKKRKQDQSHGSNDRVENPKKKEKLENVERNQREKAKEKKDIAGGMIFLCSTKTKPDCLNYRVMGVPEKQKDVVLRVKPGLKLFLYDFDLKLMYGIYKASSAGGEKLEPRAFGGFFPYQVRFNVHADCFPLPESVFKKAIAENYITKYKFKTELTIKQVRKLSELFRPVEFHGNVQPQLDSLPAWFVRKEKPRDRDARSNRRKSQHYSKRETLRNDSHVGREERRYPPPAHERDRLVANRKVRQEPPRDMFLTENEYRAYGLRGERRDAEIPSHAAPPLDPYWEDYERRRQSDVVHWDPVPAHREYVHAGPSHSDYRDYQTYPYDSRREYPQVDRYSDYRTGVDVSSSEAYRTEPDRDYHRREIDPVDRTYSHSSTADYDLMRRYQIMDPGTAALPVSSRYTFAGPR